MLFKLSLQPVDSRPHPQVHSQHFILAYCKVGQHCKAGRGGLVYEASVRQVAIVQHRCAIS